MIRLVRGFAALRWRLFVNGLKGRRRDAFEQVSRVTRLLVFALLAVSFVPGSILLAVLAYAGGRGLAAGNEKALPVLIGARAVLALVVVVTALSPLLRFGGGSASMTRLALLPISRRALFATELAAQLVDPWILFILAPLAALTVGLAAGGNLAASAWALAAGALLVGFVAALGCFASLLGTLVFRHRRLGEVASVAILIGVTLLAYAPMVASRGRLLERPRSNGERPAARFLPFDAAKHPWMAGAPWELYARTIEAAAGPGTKPAAIPAAALGLLALALAGSARFIFGRLLDEPGERASRGKRGLERIVRVPGLGPAAAAVGRAFFRLITRSVRGRVVLFTAPLPAFLLGFAWRGRPMGFVDDAYTGVLVVGAAGLLALISMTSFLSDQFAVDRAGLTLTFLSPTSGAEIVAGKALGGMAALAIPVGLGTLAAAALHPRGSPLVWLAALMGIAASYLVQSPVAAALAAWFPAPFDLAHLKGGNPHPLASILASLFAVAAYAVCGGILALTLRLSPRPGTALVAAVVVLGGAAAAARAGWRLAGRALDARRENLAMMAEGR